MPGDPECRFGFLHKIATFSGEGECFADAGVGGARIRAFSRVLGQSQIGFCSVVHAPGSALLQTLQGALDWHYAGMYVSVAGALERDVGSLGQIVKCERNCAGGWFGENDC